MSWLRAGASARGGGGRVVVLVPALNEEATVGRVVGELLAAGYPALVIDDGSSDWTATRAVEAGATVLRLPVNVGVGGALRWVFATPSPTATTSPSSATPMVSIGPRRSSSSWP